MKVTMKEIAERAGVHPSTVDKVVHHRVGVSDEVRARVQAIINELGYTPNPSGRVLQRQGKVYRISAILVQVDALPYLKKGIERGVKEQTGFDIEITYAVTGFQEAKRQSEYIIKAVEEKADGIILSPINAECVRRAIDRAADAGIPVITTDSDIDGSRRTCCVSIDSARASRIAGRLMGQFLNGNGNTQIEVLNLMGNQLTGGFPAAVADMSSLKYLNLSENAIGGTIPDLSALNNLISLSAWQCGLTGTIPETLYSLSGLQILDLSENKLEGEISAGIANLADLQYLALDTNPLRGVLPDAFTQTALTEIHLENTYLRGFVPATLKARHDAGAKVYLNNNYMTGAVLKDMPNNSGNFTDGAASEQHQLAGTRSTVTVSKDGTVNLYALLLNKSLTTGSTAKVLLRPDEYVVTFDDTKVQVTADSSGIYVKALTDIPLNTNFSITIQIKDNTGSEYSKVKLTLTTDVTSGGGGGIGGGGGGTTETPKAEHKLYINGFTDGMFHAERNITREQTAKMLIDALEKETAEPEQSSYTDVANNRWSYRWVEAASKEGYMVGYNGGVFKPDSAITRAEMATALSRIAAKEGLIMTSSTKTFSDVADGKWYSSYIRQAVQYGLISGYTDGTFRPEQYITRAETVTMINRMLGRNYETAAELHSMACPFPDVSQSSWAYGNIMEAAITHKH